MEQQKRHARVLPGWVYDGLHLSSLAFGGIGGLRFVDDGAPMCVMGHVGNTVDYDFEPRTPEGKALVAAFGRWPGGENNEAVQAVNASKYGPWGDLSQRISFEEWCEELNVVADYMVK